MASTHNRTRQLKVIGERDRARLTYLELAIVLSSATLFFQLFPSAWSRLVVLAFDFMGYFDVRDWTWRSYSVAFSIALAVLVLMKARNDNSEN
jgi:hypothetical protein